jgi:hypothetical protein
MYAASIWYPYSGSCTASFFSSISAIGSEWRSTERRPIFSASGAFVAAVSSTV